jgi:hypothetical protein
MAKASRPFDEHIQELKLKTKRSWRDLRAGCNDLLGNKVGAATYHVAAVSRSFARKVAAETGTDYREILKWLDRNKLGTE